MHSFSFRLYVTGDTERSRRAVSKLRELCEHRIAGDYELDIVNVLEQPELAEEDRIIATPTVIRRLPLPYRRVIGDLTDLYLTATALEIPDLQPSSEEKGGLL